MRRTLPTPPPSGPHGRSATLAAWLALALAAAAQSTWLRQDSNTPELLSGVTHGNGTHVSVGENGAVVTSPDAATWTAVNPGTTATLRAILHDGGQFIAAGEEGALLTSPDGTTWTARTSGVSGFLSGLAFGVGIHVAVGANGTIITSPDGISWTPASSGTGEFLQSVNHAGGLFVACGAGGTILTSTTGVFWDVQPSPTTSFLVGCGYFGGRHYVVGQNGVIASSQNGSNWSLENSGTLNRLRSFASDGTTAIVCGDGGTLLKSGDGALWSPVASGQTVILSGATFAEGRFVVVGEPVTNDGLILVGDQDPGILWGSITLTVNESTGPAILTVERLGPTTEAASIDFQTAPGTATGDVDFISSAGTAEFAIGESSADIVIPIANNPEAEPPEDFTVTLSNPTPSALTLYNPASATVNIIDAQDSDFDGLPDEWEILHFGDVESQGPADDPDNDNNSNQRELADGTGPADPDSASYLLNLGVASGLGTVGASPDLASYPKGTTVTVTPSGTGAFTFASWQGDATGTADPLVFSITSDLAINAVFEVTLANALDEPTLGWSVGGSGPAWQGQINVTSDGIDAAATGGLAAGQQSSLESTIYGPATIRFDWKVSTGSFDSLRFMIDSSSRATSSGESDWQTKNFLVGAGTHTVRWIYGKSTSLPGGSNQAWVDRVSVSYGFEDWKAAYFTSLERLDPSVSDPEADPDGDGLPNLFEYLFDLHPKSLDGDSPKLPVLSFEESGAQEFPALTWSQHATRADYVALTVESSDTLAPGSWQPLAAPILPISTSGALETVRWTSPNPSATTPRSFFRLRVSLLP